jgi:endonuclease V-like protein UPF0215 family
METTIPLHLEKKGIRALAIAESFKISCKYAVLAGVVMRRDLIIDGIGMSKSTIWGDDSTQNIISMCRRMHRNDINCIFLGGMIISMFNIIDGSKIYQSTGIPVIAITFKSSRGIAGTIRKVFPNEWQTKLQQYRNLGKRHKIKLRTGKSVFVRQWGLSLLNSIIMLNYFTLQGSIPEPVRIAKLIARASIENSEAL